MSGGPGGGSPPCWMENYSRQFFVPKGADVYHYSDTIPLSWYAGKIPTNIKGAPLVVPVTLSLQSETDGESAAAQTIINKTSFAYGAAPGVHGINWGYIDPCNNTKMTYNWTIPITQTIGNNVKYTLYARNMTNTSSPYIMASSQPFLIQAAVADPSPSTSIESSSTSPPTNLLPTGPTSADVTSTPIPGLAPEAKIGIGVSVPIGVIALGLIGWWAWRRHLKPHHPNIAMAGPGHYNTPEPDAVPQKHLAEIGGDDIVEADDENTYTITTPTLQRPTGGRSSLWSLFMTENQRHHPYASNTVRVDLGAGGVGKGTVHQALATRTGYEPLVLTESVQA
ncbi:hypothetical protein NUW58_g3966 [Xylaria curta]|uniref:Uncharacterized protein n=1 Tax=Xylaria curta TaxID=42375 RepID=A0ACC1P9T7_9PEZI|nr:hypothetical protein NUW58_g3966 [Xylaria curta]